MEIHTIFCCFITGLKNPKAMEVITHTKTTKTVVTTSTSKTVKQSAVSARRKHCSVQNAKKQTVNKKRTSRSERKSAGKRAQWACEDMKRAMNAVKTQTMGLNEAARTYSVPKATLRRHVRRLNIHACDGVKRLGRSSDLPNDVEMDLLQHILLLESRFYGLTRESLMTLAYQMAKANGIKTRFNDTKQKAGNEWLRGFLSRHPEISLRIPEATSLARAAGFNRQRVGEFFKLLQKIAEEENLTAERVFNVDETGFTAVQKPQKVLARKGKHQVGSITSCERGRNITFVCCSSASGRYVPPMIIYPRKNLKIELTEGAPPGSIYACQENGWINCDLFLIWFEHFLATVKPSNDNKVLLVLDGHVSHTQNIQVILRARENGVIMLSLPPHCTHRLQPLDLTFFKPLSSYYNKCVDNWMRSNPGLPVTEQKVTKFFGEAYSQAACISTAVNGFKKGGVWPVNPNAIEDEEFAPSDVTEQHLAIQMPATSPVLPPICRTGIGSVELVSNANETSPIEPTQQNCLAAGYVQVSSVDENGCSQAGLLTLEVAIENDDTDEIPQQSCSPTSESAHVMPQSEYGSSLPTPKRITAVMLSPLPVRKPVQSSKRRAGLGATILTASPYKQQLLEKVKHKECQTKSRPVNLKSQIKKKTKQKTTKLRKDKSTNQSKPPVPVNQRPPLPRKPVYLDKGVEEDGTGRPTFIVFLPRISKSGFLFKLNVAIFSRCTFSVSLYVYSY
jgi:hypothetical protein